MRNLGFARVTERTVREKLTIEWTPYSKLPPLPDTRDEILAIASALKADKDRDIFLGAAATKATALNGVLSDSRIVAFATHGLLPGDFPGLSQPALALAVSEGKDADKEPISAILTLEDVLSLKLNAEWVVLSACNTAAGDGAGAEAISGLGRGFFYAGSRALLVTQWPVETVSARKIVTSLFEKYSANPSLPRAEALKLAMLDVMQDGEREGTNNKLLYSYAHPMFWAPYVLIGDGGR